METTKMVSAAEKRQNSSILTAENTPSPRSGYLVVDPESGTFTHSKGIDFNELWKAQLANQSDYGTKSRFGASSEPHFGVTIMFEAFTVKFCLLSRV